MTITDPHTGNSHSGIKPRATLAAVVAGGAWAIAMVVGVLVFATAYCAINAVSLVYRLIAGGVSRLGPRRG